MDLNIDTVDIYNLKENCKYYYRLYLTFTQGREMTFGGAFETADYPRILSIDGIRNVRDFGGFKTTDGKVVKQGYLYRGTELDGAVEAKYKLSEKGRKQLISLGIKRDMDLRDKDDSVPGEYILGANVEHKYYNADNYAGVFTNEGKAVIKEIFSDLAKPESYPTYLHCTYGTDRTGTVCYILGAMLGMSEDDLIRSYELSGLLVDSITREGVVNIYNSLQEYDGVSLKEKAENYLLSTGLHYREIQSIRDIFLQ